MAQFDLIEIPFDWNDNFSEIAMEDFRLIQKDLPYCSCQTIGMALAKLELLENQGAKIKEQEIDEIKDEGLTCAYILGKHDGYEQGRADAITQIKTKLEYEFGQSVGIPNNFKVFAKCVISNVVAELKEQDEKEKTKEEI